MDGAPHMHNQLAIQNPLRSRFLFHGARFAIACPLLICRDQFNTMSALPVDIAFTQPSMEI
ncbi:MAG: hypothetical protein A3G29_06380 [Burkholderiales bacterium RIFCSPLOWO2_12_FULL_64_99]|nr:MAG: hypothetical protein A3E52_03225 [Burkholderiales bacterium RIFCSPHIGHO2_12_FULL_63_20]OGB61108.1 MAG: hypothetical protein A3G29_06380 [Burkholderiales bacterium RIFCSPLOWO2_12_FULL_64_99]